MFLLKNAGNAFQLSCEFFMKNIIFLFLITLSSICYAQDFVVFEEFNNLDNWHEVKLPLVSRSSSYSIEKLGEMNLLRCESEASASSLQHTKKFNVYDYPIVSWRWKINNILSKGDVTKKSGDDYPIRIYINFSHDENTSQAGFMFKYNFVKKVYDLEIPRFSLNYIIESKTQTSDIYPNTFDPENSKIIILRSGEASINQWFIEKIHIVNDFKRAYGFEPPKIAYIAIMTDTDNTKEKTLAWLDYIKVGTEE